MINIWKFTTLKTKNFAKNFLELKEEKDLEKIHKIFQQNKKHICIWWGSNILFSQKIYEEIFFLKNELKGTQRLDKNLFKIKSWENLGKFINYINKDLNNFSLNPLFWIPGSIGGAVIGNAWCFWIEIWNFVEKIKYIDNKGNLQENEKYKCWYRWSNLKSKNLLLLEVTLNIPQNQNPDILGLKEYINWRKEKQENTNSCWSFFKNPILNKEKDQKIIENILSFKDHPIKDKENTEITIPAWWLIEKTGLKWYEINWVKISEKHSNFISNYNNEDPENITELAKTIKWKTFEKFWINLEEEVNII